MAQHSPSITQTGNILTVAQQWFRQQRIMPERASSQAEEDPQGRALYERVRRIADQVMQENQGFGGITDS